MEIIDKKKRNSNGLLFTFIPAFIAFIVTYPVWNDSETSLVTDPSLQATTFIAPLDLSNAKVAAKFGQLPHPTTGKIILHTGLDLVSRQGEPVFAASSGKVIKAAFDANRGNHVVIRHSDTYTTSYSHLKSLAVKAGQVIESGAIVGSVGSTGLSSAPHLHFEVLKNGKAVDPAEYLPKQ